MSNVNHVNSDDNESSSPIGIYGLSPSSDAIVTESTWSTISPIGSPIANYLPSVGNSPRFNNDLRSYSFDPKFSKDSFMKHNDGDDNLLSKFEKLSVSPNLRSTFHKSFQHNHSTISPSGPNVPLLKQKSLPSQFLSTSSSFQEKSQFNFRNMQYLQVPGQYDMSSRKSPRSTTDMIWEDESREDWFDQFGGIEIEQNPNQTTVNQNNGPISSYLEKTRRSSDTVRYLNSNTMESPRSYTSQQQLSSSHTSTSIGSYVKKPSNVQMRSTKTTHTYNLKHQSRIISIQNANLFNIESLYACFSKYGEIRSTVKSNNVFLISYYDIRHSQAAMANLNGKHLNDVPLELNYYFLKDFSNTDEVNQGTLVIFNLDPSVSIAELHRIFGAYGEIREIRESPNRKHKFVEFYDVREAEIAMKNLNKTEIGGKKIKIEPSKPGSNKNDNNNKRLNHQVSTSAPSNTSPIMIRLNEERDDHNSGSSYKSRGKMGHYGKNSKSHSPNHDDNTNEDDKSPIFELNVSKILSGEDKRTSLMIKNIPNKYNQEMVLETLNQNHDGLYDFFYLPIDFKNKCNVGYAFINFKDPLSIPAFYEEFNNKKWKKFNSEKVCQISYARIQGKYAMLEHFKNSSLLFEDAKCQPLIFHDGESEPLPIGSNFLRNQ